MSVVRRTVRVKLDIQQEDAQSLDKTNQEYLKACNKITEEAWSDEEEIITSKTKLHEQTYDKIRKTTNLHSQHVQHARNQVIKSLKGILAKWEKGEKATKPHFNSKTIPYCKKTLTIKDNTASIATINGRIQAKMTLPHEQDQENPHSYYMNSKEWEQAESKLVKNNQKWYIHLGFKKQVPEKEDEKENRTVLGVDLGINQLAVTSTGKFWSGGELKHRRKEYEKTRSNLQETATRSAHKTIKNLGGRESNYNKNHLHNISKKIVEEAMENECNIIAFEDLTGIRKRMTNVKDFHVWAFHQLQDYVEYKAKTKGIKVVKVNPENTSKICSYCGSIGERDGEKFECDTCEKKYHADYNAARNIAWKHLLRPGQKSQAGGATSHLALKSGPLDISKATDKPMAFSHG